MGIEEKLTPLTEDEFFEIIEYQLELLNKKIDKTEDAAYKILRMYNKALSLKNRYHMDYYLTKTNEITYVKGDKKVIGFKSGKKE